MSDNPLKTWGGDAKVVASSIEIERVLAKIRLAEECLRSMVTPFSLLGQAGSDLGEGLSSGFGGGFGQAKSIAVGLELPALIQKLEHLELACLEASRAYFQGETEIAADIPSLAEAAVDAGVFRETGVQVREVSASGAPMSHSELSLGVGQSEMLGNPQKSPDRLTELIWHLQRTDERSKNQIRVDRLAPITGATADPLVQDPLFIAYVPGTQEWALNAGDNAFDATSNVAAMANPGLAASERGVEQALAMAGAVAGSRVLLVGHSQGGIISANLASRSGFHFFNGPAPTTQFKVVGLVTAGAPIGHLRNQMNVPTMALEHSNDLVPKLDGQLNPNRSNWVTATRKIPEASPLEAHRLENYVETAKLVDQADDAGASAIRSKILDLTRGTQVVETRWFELTRAGGSR
jgi:pimeloyl-ACP methyl ester carboxylesterase